LIDNARMAVGGWACEASCFASNPQPDLADGLGELEIKPKTLRFVVCANRDLVEDAAFDFETWLYRKIFEGMRALNGRYRGRGLIDLRGLEVLGVNVSANRAGSWRRP
jgi:hypothetical protein